MIDGFTYVVMKKILFILTFLLTCSYCWADARVDGFFGDSLVKDGFFAERSDIKKESPRPRFFISREERRLHPENAPSNSITIPRNVYRVSNRPAILPNGGMSDIWSVGVSQHQVP